MAEDDDDDAAMIRAMAKFSAVADLDDEAPAPAPRARPRRPVPAPKARRRQAERLKATVDGRSLRETGRTSQFNFKCKPEIKTAAQEMADERGLTIAEFMESLIEQARGDE